MNGNEQYPLDEAIKKFFKEEPLKIDLAKAVANSVFAKEKKKSTVFDKMLYLAICLIAFVTVVYCCSLLSKLSIPGIILFLIIIVSFFGFSFKEYTILSKKILKFK